MSISSNIGDAVKLFVQGDVKAPVRTKGNCGIDLFCPNLTEQFIKDLADKNPGQPFRWGLLGAPQDENNPNKGSFLYVPAGEDILIPSYVSARIPDNIFLHMTDKSGVSTQQKLIIGANTIDSSYTGIIHIHIYNPSNTIRFIQFGQKLAQMVPIVFDNQDIEIFYDNKIEAFKEYKNFVSKEEFFEGHDTTIRGDQGFGSTQEKK